MGQLLAEATITVQAVIAAIDTLPPEQAKIAYDLLDKANEHLAEARKHLRSAYYIAKGEELIVEAEN